LIDEAPRETKPPHGPKAGGGINDQVRARYQGFILHFVLRAGLRGFDSFAMALGGLHRLASHTSRALALLFGGFSHLAALLSYRVQGHPLELDELVHGPLGKIAELFDAWNVAEHLPPKVRSIGILLVCDVQKLPL